jgi:hypothetical protein
MNNISKLNSHSYYFLCSILFKIIKQVVIIPIIVIKNSSSSFLFFVVVVVVEKNETSQTNQTKRHIYTTTKNEKL